MKLITIRKGSAKDKLYRGARVKLISNQHGVNENNPVWGEYEEEVLGIIITLPDEDNAFGEMIDVEWNNGTQNSYYESDLELI